MSPQCTRKHMADCGCADTVAFGQPQITPATRTQSSQFTDFRVRQFVAVAFFAVLCVGLLVCGVRYVAKIGVVVVALVAITMVYDVRGWYRSKESNSDKPVDSPPLAMAVDTQLYGGITSIILPKRKNPAPRCSMGLTTTSYAAIVRDFVPPLETGGRLPSLCLHDNLLSLCINRTALVGSQRMYK